MTFDHDRQLRDLIQKEVRRQLGRPSKEIRQLPYQPWMPTWRRYLVRHRGNARKAWRHYRSDDPSAPSRHTLYEYRKRCPRFAEEWAQALEEAAQSDGPADDSLGPPDPGRDPHPGSPPIYDPMSEINYW